MPATNGPALKPVRILLVANRERDAAALAAALQSFENEVEILRLPNCRMLLSTLSKASEDRIAIVARADTQCVRKLDGFLQRQETPTPVVVLTDPGQAGPPPPSRPNAAIRIDRDRLEHLEPLIRLSCEKRRLRQTLLKRHQRLVDNLDAIFWQTDASGTVTRVSPSVNGQLGVAAEAIRGRKARSLFADRKQWVAFVRQLLTTGRVEGTRIGIRAPSSEPAWLVVSAWKRTAPHGGLRGFEGLARNVSHDKFAEDALRLSETRYRQLYDNLRDGFAAVDLQGRIIEFNPAFRTMLGYEAAELRSLTYRDLTPAKWRKREERIITEQVLGRGYSESYEKEYRRKDGSVVPVELRTYLMRDPEGRPAGMWAFVHDTTRRKRIEEAALLLVTAIEQSAEMILITDPEGKIQYVNPAFERITGYRRQEAVGATPRILKSGQQDQKFYARMWRDLRRGQGWSGRLVNRKKDGTLFEEEATISPVRDAEGTITNYVAVKRDVTAELRMEQQLHQAQKMEAIGTLASGIAHDFNNILSAIIGYSELVQEELPPDGNTRRNLHEVFRAAERARELVRQILTFSRHDARQRTAVDIRPIIREALKLLRSSLPSTIAIAPSLNATPAVLADPTQIHQVVMNLCTNAYHAMADRGGTLSVSLQEATITTPLPAPHQYPRLSPGRYARLTVADTGCGIPGAMLERIFDPYFTTKTKEKGTGLGLAVVRGIVEKSDGTVAVYSRPEQGTTFEIYLPVAQGGQKRIMPSKATPAGGREHILFVDDEATIVAMNVQVLTRLGYRVSAFTDSRDALEAFRRRPQRYDLVITDMTMPGLTGAELARAMLAIRPGMPIMLCTGYSELITEKQARASGIRAYIQKPINKAEIAAAIRAALQAPPASVKGRG